MEVVEEDEYGDGWGHLEWADVEEPQGGSDPITLALRKTQPSARWRGTWDESWVDTAWECRQRMPEKARRPKMARIMQDITGIIAVIRTGWRPVWGTHNTLAHAPDHGEKNRAKVLKIFRGWSNMRARLEGVVKRVELRGFKVDGAVERAIKEKDAVQIASWLSSEAVPAHPAPGTIRAGFQEVGTTQRPQPHKEKRKKKKWVKKDGEGKVVGGAGLFQYWEQSKEGEEEGGEAREREGAESNHRSNNSCSSRDSGNSTSSSSNKERCQEGKKEVMETRQA
jgi:hypothetical protein